MVENIKLGLDAVAGAVTIGALMGYLPPIAAAMSILWISIQLYDRFKGKK